MGHYSELLLALSTHGFVLLPVHSTQLVCCEKFLTVDREYSEVLLVQRGEGRRGEEKREERRVRRRGEERRSQMRGERREETADQMAGEERRRQR